MAVTGKGRCCFDPVSDQNWPGRRIEDRFPDRFSWHPVIGKGDEALADHRILLDAALYEARDDPGCIYAATDASLPLRGRFQAVAASVVAKGRNTLRAPRTAVGRVASHDAELFAIRGAVSVLRDHEVERFVLFTDHLPSARRALDPSLHSGQAHSLVVCSTLAAWLAGSPARRVEIWQVPSKLKWGFHT